MGVRLKLLSEYGVTMCVFSGVVTPEDADEFNNRVTPADAGIVINYFEPTADLTKILAADVPELRRRVANRLRELYGDKPPIVAWVCAPGLNKPLADFWCRYVQVSGDHPTSPALFPSLKAACDWLDLPERVHEALMEAVEPEPTAREVRSVRHPSTRHL
jgi:hypothetical protein